MIFSIDPEGCKDIDDAIHLEIINKHIYVGVHIADITHYIKHNDIIDKNA